MDQLPEHLLVDVLALLPLVDLLNAALVCRRWAAAVHHRLVVVGGRGSQHRPAGRATRVLVVTRQTTAIASLPMLLEAAPALRELTVYVRYPLDAAELQAVGALPRLRHLDAFVSGGVLRAPAVDAALLGLEEFVLNDAAAPGALRRLAAAPRLRRFHMYGRAWHYSRRALNALLHTRADVLTELTLRCSELTTRDYAAVGGCGALLELRLYSCWLLTGSGAAHVARPRRLRVLHVSGARPLWPRSLHAFLAALPAGLEELALSAGRFGDEHAEGLRRLAGLRSLELWRCGVTARGLAAAAGALPRLVELDTDAELSAADVDALAEHGALRRLRCGGAGGRGGRGRLLVVRAASAPCGRRIRGEGEGPHADTYHSWERHRSALAAAAAALSTTCHSATTYSEYDDTDNTSLLLGSDLDHNLYYN